MLLNPFAIVDNNIIHISEVNKDDVWNTYTCPECGEPLIARTGKVNTWHFAHKSLSKCKFGLSNESIGESPIHRYAKRIIKESAYVAAPKTYDGTKRHIFLKSTKEEYSSGERVVDVLAISKENEEIAIEIFYKHKVDEQKIQDLKNRFFIVMEIKIPDNLEDLSNIEKFKEGVLKTYPRAWIVLDKTTTYYKDDFYARKGIEIRKKIAEIQIQNNKLKIQEDNLKRKERALKREHEDIE